MKIAIICSSLDPGRDGVGDYTRQLSQELSKNHQVAIFSLRDVENNHQPEAPVSIQRFRDAMTSVRNSQLLTTEILNFAPDFISLQVVPFGFHRRGLIKELIPLMVEVSRCAPLGVMFHELWLGEKPSRPIKHKILGQIQKHYVLKALKKWEPGLIHTSNPLYQSVLERNGYASKLLPLFGNIPIAPEASGKAKAQNLLSPNSTPENERTILFPFSQSKEWMAPRVTEILIEASKIAEVTLHFVQVGKNPAQALHWPQIESRLESAGHRCTIWGPTDQTTLSNLMQIADIGVSSAHIQLAGKSGGVIGMLEHGLPVICTSWDKESRYPVSKSPELEGIYSIEEPLEEITKLLSNPKKQTPASRLPVVAKKFSDDIEAFLKP